MKNVMVCVTKQKTCERLIRRGYEYLGDEEGELYIIHVAHYELNFMESDKEGEALEYLYEKALEFGANLTVVRSNHVIDTLAELVSKNSITDLILGESGENSGESQFLTKLRNKVKGKAEIIVVPAE